MTLRKSLLCGALALAVSLTGCAKAVQILQPDPGANAPWNPDDRGNAEFRTYPDCVQRFVVKFHDNINPESFRAELDGIDVTSKFTPLPAAPGGTATAPAPPVFHEGIPYSYPVWGEMGTLGVGSSYRVSEATIFWHKLVVHGTLKTTGLWFWDHDQVNFFLPRPAFKPDYLRLTKNQPVATFVDVRLDLAPTTGPLAVTISPFTLLFASGLGGPTKIVSLNDQAPGTPIILTFNVGETVKTFHVKPVPPLASGTFGLALLAEASGCQLGGVAGEID